MIYTKKHAEAVRSLGPPPLPVTMDIVEAPDGELKVVVYEQQVMSYEKLDRIVLMEYLQKVRQTLVDMGLVVSLEGRNRPV